MRKQLICDGFKAKQLSETAMWCFGAIVGNPPNHNFRYNRVDEVLFIINTLNAMVDNYVKNEPTVFERMFIAQGKPDKTDTEEASEAEPEVICPRCINSEINPGDKFCKICGLPLGDGSV